VRRLPLFLLGVCGLFGSLAATAQDAVTLGVHESYRLESPHPYGVAFGGAARSWTIQYPDATYIRVHFSAFDLAPGDRLEIAAPDGSDSHVYTLLGPHKSGEFWAFTVLGDAAVIRLESVSGHGYGFEIDGLGKGVKPLVPEPLDPKTVCGPKDWKDVVCYDVSNPTEVANSRGSVLALSGCCVTCSAFKVSDSGQFMTNNHCISTETGVETTELRFDYERPGCGVGRAGSSGSVMGGTLLQTDVDLDYTLFTTLGDSSAIPCLELEDRLGPLNERIYIPSHPSGGPKTLSLASTHPQDPSGFCEVDASPLVGNDNDIGYYCDTADGSSGSPVISGLTHKVIALHHYGGCLNSGVRMDRIVPAITGLLDTCGAGAGWCGNDECAVDENQCSCAQDCGAPPLTEVGACADTADNDCDLLTDCADPDCVGDPACPTCSPIGAPCANQSDCCSGRCKGQGANRTCRPS
jgi:lysyl endopeptidase